MTPKVVMFNIDVDTTPANPADGGDDNQEHSKLGLSLKILIFLMEHIYSKNSLDTKL